MSPSKPEPAIVTRHQLAAIFGCHPDRLSEYAAAGMPVAQRGGLGGRDRRSRYDAIACAEWVRRHRPGLVDGQQARARLDDTRRQEVEHRLKIKRGEYARIADLEGVWSRIVITARNQFLGLGTRFKSRCPHVASADLLVLDGLVREILEALADGRSPEAAA